MDSEIEEDMSILRTYFRNNFVQRIYEMRLKYEGKLSFKTFNAEALERDELAQKGLIEVQGEDIIKRVRSASFDPSNKEQVIAAREFLSYLLLLSFNFLNTGQ